MSFAAAVQRFLDEPRRAALASNAENVDRLERAWEEARRDNPELGVSEDAFARFVAERLPASDGAKMLTHVHPADLYLACACMAGDRRAHAKLEERFGAELLAVAKRFAKDGLDVEDLLQTFRVKVLVGDGDRPPKLADYDGQGFLQNWVRITALRTFIDMQRGARARAMKEEPASISEAAGGTSDLELDFLKQEYRVHFREAFGRAIRALDPKDRAMLRHHAVARLTIDQIGAIYHVHRATAARRLADARKSLLELLRAELRRATKIDDAEIDSVLDLVQSQLDVSFQRLLDTREGSS